MDPKMDNTRAAAHSFEVAARSLDNAFANDNSAPTLLDVMNVVPHMNPTGSGASDNDYPNLSRLPPALSNIPQIKTANKVPLPPEILERFNRILYLCVTKFTKMLY